MTTFAEAARRLAGLAGAVFGWRADEFWRATPVELATLVQACVPAATPPPDAATIAAMQEAFPDG
ncbi:hypothetical protein J2Y58_002286 [Sphingomonas sp. BE138]|uniref:phage tail assembly chaperone n=1 Tax=Sphingomonas sp. BE138 TaxID=2817845 RepID=UPI00286776FA|nr:phage tail assembly chaperone [Sphingomonas sp. BE138]MDR6788921.1 hypothetical protein [Sphingomonas sp. BE138]